MIQAKLATTPFSQQGFTSNCFSPLFARQKLPPMWESLESFVDWYMASGMPMAIPFDAEVFRTDNASSFCLFRRPPYQVELYVIDGDEDVWDHAHPLVEVLQVTLSGPDQMAAPFDEDSVAANLAATWGAATQKMVSGQSHGAQDGNRIQTHGHITLTFEKWPAEAYPSTVAAVWKGRTVGPKHDALIRRFFPAAFIEDGYADITRLAP